MKKSEDQKRQLKRKPALNPQDLKTKAFVA